MDRIAGIPLVYVVNRGMAVAAELATDSLEIYFARCLGIGLLTIAVIILMLTGSIPLTSSISSPITTDDSDPRAPYAIPTLIVTSLFHSASAFNVYSWYIVGGQTAFAAAVGANSLLAFIGLWCVLFANSNGKISTKTGLDKRTAGFPFKNSEAYKKHSDKKGL
ncbi:hypothetical protein N7495_003793 [Penicillium taxi]|uniref:uncharacterized protein n=1 Tax=Penicillium taxi TaxID=168475 RepID=UPI0025451F86|nr:uncharacterized protein N7495_003793 [Penicillium taxi]KAJ5899049.1 hypothetical protein N7495_003793 [Penicillium taxi]